MINLKWKCLFFCLFLFSIRLEAVVCTWDGNVDSEFNNSANWTPSIPNSNDIASFPNAATVSAFPIIDSHTNSVLGLVYDSTTSFIFDIRNGSILNIGDSGIADIENHISPHLIRIVNGSEVTITGSIDSSNFNYDVDRSLLEFLNGSVFPGGTVDIIGTLANPGQVHFGDESVSNGGTFNISQFGSVLFDDSSVANAGTFNLNGTNSATNMPVLTFDVDGVVGSNVLINVLNGGTGTAAQINFSSTNELVVNATLTSDPAVSLLGGLNFNGGTITFTSDSSNYVQPVSVNTGTLILTGILGNTDDPLTNMLVKGGARLEGTGTVGNDLILQDNANAVIAPGIDGEIGTLFVGNNLTMNEGTYEAIIDPQGNATLIDVGGTANISDATLDVLIQFTDVHGGLFKVLSASNVNGPFATFTNNVTNPLIDIAPVYLPKAVFVSFQVPLINVVKTSNQMNILEVLVSDLNPTGDILFVDTVLDGLPLNQVPNALDQISGQQYTNFVEISYNAANHFSRRLNMATRSRVVCQPCCGRDYFVWVEGGGGQSDYNGDSLADGLDTRNYIASCGIQVLNEYGWMLGLAAFYERENIDFDLKGSAHADIVQGAFYTAYNNRWGYFLANAIYGCNYFKMRRPIQFGEIDRLATSNGRVWSGNFYAEYGFNNYYLGCIDSQQYIGVDFGYFYQKKIQERGAGSLTLEIDSLKSYRYDFVVGSRFLIRLPCDFSMELDLDYRHRFNKDRVGIDVTAAGIEQSFNIRGFKLGKDGLEGSLTLLGTIYRDVQWYLRATGETWGHYKDYTATTGFIYHW